MANETQESTNARCLLEQTHRSTAVGAVGLVGDQQAAEAAFGSLLTGSITSKSLITSGCWRLLSRPSIRPSELWNAQASTKVPSNKKCFVLSSGLASGAASKCWKNVGMSSSFRSRSRFLVNVTWHP
jgi:hypothetical protein